MFPFKAIFPTPKEHTPWINTCQYICLHHTWTKEGTIKGVLDGLNKRADYASCHFIVDVNWDCYKIWSPKDILWHAWVSSWWKLKDMNKYSVWIEVIWPLSNGGFTKEQKIAVRRLIQHLMAVLNVPLRMCSDIKILHQKERWILLIHSGMTNIYLSDNM